MAVVIPYVKQTWTDGVSQATAARLGVIEDGINDAHRMPCARVFHNANQSIATSTFTVLALNSERYDTDTIHDTVTNNSRLTCKHAGKYQIIGQAQFAASSAGTVRHVEILLNGTTVIAVQEGPSLGASVAPVLVVPTHYDLAVNDFVEMRVFQDTGGALNVLSTANHSPEFMMVRIAT